MLNFGKTFSILCQIFQYSNQNCCNSSWRQPNLNLNFVKLNSTKYELSNRNYNRKSSSNRCDFIIYTPYFLKFSKKKIRNQIFEIIILINIQHLCAKAAKVKWKENHKGKWETINHTTGEVTYKFIQIQPQKHMKH